LLTRIENAIRRHSSCRSWLRRLTLLRSLDEVEIGPLSPSAGLEQLHRADVGPILCSRTVEPIQTKTDPAGDLVPEPSQGPSPPHSSRGCGHGLPPDHVPLVARDARELGDRDLSHLVDYVGLGSAPQGAPPFISISVLPDWRYPVQPDRRSRGVWGGRSGGELHLLVSQEVPRLGPGSARPLRRSSRTPGGSDLAEALLPGVLVWSSLRWRRSAAACPSDRAQSENAPKMLLSIAV